LQLYFYYFYRELTLHWTLKQLGEIEPAGDITDQLCSLIRCCEKLKPR